MRYRRASTAGATYFFTVNLADRKSNLLTDNIEKLRQALRTIRQSHPFEIIAMVVLPDRLHAEIGWDVRMKKNDIYRGIKMNRGLNEVMDLKCLQGMLGFLRQPNLGVALVALTLLSFAGCKERPPMEGSPDYYKLHGIVNDGKTVNEITLINDRNNNRPKLRFPADIAVGVVTEGLNDPVPNQIRKGFANEASVWLGLSEKKWLIPVVMMPDHMGYEAVRIRLIASLGSQTDATEKLIHKIAQLSVHTTTDRHDVELREYRPKSPGWGQGFYFVPLDDAFRLFDGEKLIIECEGTTRSNGNIGTCGASFNHPSGTAVAFHFHSKNLPYWRQIYTEIYKFTDSVVVK